MKLEKVDRFTASCAPFSVFVYIRDIKDGGDLLFAGSSNGNITYYRLQSSTKSSSGSRAEEFTRFNAVQNHKGPIECLLHSSNEKVCSSSNFPLGLLFSGGRDQTIKLWDPLNVTKPLLQTLVGHSGIITSIADGNDGTMLSCSSDGSIKMWAPQKGRTLFKDPFFECTLNISTGKGDLWLSSLVVSTVGAWTLYAADSTGSIELFRKGGSSSYDPESYAAQFTHAVSKFRRWDNVHELTITGLLLIPEESFLVSISYDGTCKILDAIVGHILFTVM